jgi:hypothetical protein
MAGQMLGVDQETFAKMTEPDKPFTFFHPVYERIRARMWLST